MRKKNYTSPEQGDNMEDIMKRTFAEIGEKIEASDCLKRQIDCRILEEKKEEKSMKHFSMKKVVIGVAAASLLIGAVGIAGSGLFTTVGQVPAEPQYTEFSDTEKVEAELGENVAAVEEFDNGYEFGGASTGDETVHNEAGEAVEKKKTLKMEYKHGDDTLNFSSTKLSAGETEESVWEKQPGIDQTFEYAGIKIVYIENRYMNVTPDYVFSDEEQKAMDEGELSVGVDSVGGIDCQACFMGWVINGKLSTLSGFDISMTGEEIFEMAKEIIDIQLSEQE